MEGSLGEKQELEKQVKNMDAEIGELKREKQDFMSKIKELEAEVVMLRKFAIDTLSSSLSGKLPTRPLSLFANLPERPAFTGLDILMVNPAPQNSFFAPTASSQMFPPRLTLKSAGINPTPESTIPLTPSTRLGRRPKGTVPRRKGTVPPLLSHHQSFGAAWGSSPPSTASTLHQKFGVSNLSSGNTSGPASFGLSTADVNSHHNGPTVRDIPLPPVSSSTPISPTLSASFNFNQQTGRPPFYICGNWER